MRDVKQMNDEFMNYMNSLMEDIDKEESQRLTESVLLEQKLTDEDKKSDFEKDILEAIKLLTVETLVVGQKEIWNQSLVDDEDFAIALESLAQKLRTTFKNGEDSLIFVDVEKEPLPDESNNLDDYKDEEMEEPELESLNEDELQEELMLCDLDDFD